MGEQSSLTHGVYRYQEGAEYEGTWNADQLREGLGHISFPNGSKYSGGFHDGLCSGLGVILFQDLSRYEGEFENGRYHGYGVFTRCDGMTFQGQFENGKICGYGLVTFADGTNGLPRNEGYFEGNRLIRPERCPDSVHKAMKLAEEAKMQC